VFHRSDRMESRRSRQVKVKVEVVDVNDNAPIIELVGGAVQLYESAVVGTELYLGSARDLDTAPVTLTRHTRDLDTAVVTLTRRP